MSLRTNRPVSYSPYSLYSIYSPYSLYSLYSLYSPYSPYSLYSPYNSSHAMGKKFFQTLSAVCGQIDRLRTMAHR